MKFFITGAAGFIGSNFLQYMTENYPDDFFVGIDALTYAGNPKNLEQTTKKKNFSFIQLDITNQKGVLSLFEKTKPDAVVNFAAESHVDRSIDSTRIFLNTNLLGTDTLLHACCVHGVSRFHQVSTDEVYGELPLERLELLFTEKTPLNTSSPYSASKAAADLLVGAYHKTYDLFTTVSRCSNNYGPYQFPEKLIPLMILKALKGQDLPVYGNGLNVRDWIHVEDHCKAIDLILRKGKNGGIYNVGGGNEKSNLQIVKMILHELGKDETLIRYVPDRKGHDLRYAVDASKLQKELDWKPEIDFEEGLKSTIRWYTENQNWWENKL